MASLRVEIDGGFIEGEILTSELDQHPYYSFKGVPYARPPVGPLRFQPPESVHKWSGVINCTVERDVCTQKDTFSTSPNAFAGSEDCLYLNIFYPAENTEKFLRPVMVFIHGGGFQSGYKNSNLYGPDFLITKGVVLVTLNYRLNIFALIWVRKNIKKFNGDPENITIFGESAGSASVHYNLLSPLSKGLFHKAILQSGCILDPWAYMDPASCMDKAFRIGNHLGCRTTDAKKLHKFLLDVPAKALAEAVYSILTPEISVAWLETHEFPQRSALGIPFSPSLFANPKSADFAHMTWKLYPLDVNIRV